MSKSKLLNSRDTDLSINGVTGDNRGVAVPAHPLTGLEVC